MDSSDALTSRIHEHVEKLEQFSDGITRCDVLVEQPHRHQSQGRSFHVRVQLHLRTGQEIVVSRDPGVADAHEDPYVTLRDAFSTARRQVQEATERVRGDVKQHERERDLEREVSTEQ